MSKQQFESNVKPIPYAQSCVYAKLADLNNLAVIKERFNDPSVRAMMSGQVPEDKLNQLNERIQEMTFDTDSVSCNIPRWERFRCASSSVRNRNVSNLKRSIPLSISTCGFNCCPLPKRHAR